MEEIRANEAKEHLDDLLDRVEKGEEITITRDGRPVARLVSGTRWIGTGLHDPEAARAAAARILERSKSASLGGLSIKDLINEGRR